MGFLTAGRWMSRILSLGTSFIVFLRTRTLPIERSSILSQFGAGICLDFSCFSNTLSSDSSSSYAYSTVTFLGELPKTLASIGGIHGKRVGCARAIASFIVVFPDPFAPNIREKRLLNSHDIFACAAARYPSTVIFFRRIVASKLEKIPARISVVTRSPNATNL